MTIQTAYEFLKPSLEQFTVKEKEKLCELIKGENASHKPKRYVKKKEELPTVDEIYRSLKHSTFK